MNNHNSDRKKLYLAALLHDIGKFYQRADEKQNNNKFKYLTDEYWKLDSTYCPLYEGIYSHKHVLWTAHFIAKHQLEKKFDLKGLERLAASHHAPNPQKILELILQKADHLSSGVDRTQQEGQQDAKDESNENTYKTTQMRSIFESIVKENNNNAFQYKYFLPIKPLILDNSVFPTESKGNINYSTLWSDFENEFNNLISQNQNISNQNFNAFAESLLNLMHKYLTFVPSSTQHLPDVSLYDHSKTTAAFAVCLYDYLNARNNLKNFHLTNDEKTMLLVGGDFSGIQSYIYGIVSKFASKNLKGRSFYLQLLIDAVVEKITNELNLPKANIVYDSGGKFYLLAPNTKEVKNKLTELAQTISNKVFSRHKTDLYLAIDWTELSQNDIYNQLSEKWKELSEALSKRKRNRFADKLLSEYTYFFEACEQGGLLERDKITNEEITDKENAIYLEDLNGYIAKSTNEQIQLGGSLRNTNYLVTALDVIQQWNQQDDFIDHQNPCNLGVHYYFLNNKTAKSADNIQVRVFNNTSFLTSFSGNNIAYGFTFYGGNTVPITENGEIKGFDKLAGDGELKRLGILRMDVDNLGQVFINGFKPKKRTFSRYSTLSRSLDFFFKGYINILWGKNDFKDWIYIVYSGGDDLFIVGRWDKTIEFAELLYHEFRKWTCHNEHLTLSGGVAVVPRKFPLIKAAEMAGEAEHKAKNHRFGNQDKNAICIFDTPLNWEHEFSMVKTYQTKIYERLENDLLPMGFLQKILTLNNMRQKQIKKQENESWQWLLAYDFARMKERHKKNADLKQFIDSLQRDIITDTFEGKKNNSQYHTLELVALAARWAELKLRTLKSKNYEYA